MASIIKQINSRWSHYFTDAQFSSREFYSLVEKHVDNKKVITISVKRVNIGTWFSKREYLRVRDGKHVFDICAAPYGSGYFISWWQGESKGLIYRLMTSIPFLGPLIELSSNYKTYIQWDYISMFQRCVSMCVNEAVDEISTQKGLRRLTETERLITSRNVFR